MSGGETKCWGDNHYNQVSSGDVSITVPTKVASGSGELFAGSWASGACALSGSSLVCWGKNDCAEASGNGTAGGTVFPPEEALGARSDVVSVTVSEYHSCALLQSGVVACWGNGRYGRLGLYDAFLSGVRTSLDQCE